jgi:hypothetical protein
LAASAFVIFGAALAHAGGPKYVAGVSYFNPSVLGQPIVWPGGQLHYFVDQGTLGPLSNSDAVSMVDAAAAVWNTVPTAAVTLSDSGFLAEDVNGSNVLAGNGFLAAPADVSPSATATPVAVIFDSDGSVTDSIEGAGASEPDNCALNGPLVWIDNFNSNATFAHGVIVLNGRCASTANLQATMSYQLERAFGRILGLDFSQVNDDGFLLGTPVMQPLTGNCGTTGGSCLLDPGILRYDDIATLNRLYPVTAANLTGFPGKILTAANTISIQGTVSFRSGQGMQGVNVVARPLDANGNPLFQYTATFVSGSYFAGNRGNPVTGWLDAQGNRLDRFGSNNATLQGFFDLSGIPLPPGATAANYQVTFEAINPLFVDSTSVGPYLLGSPSPSGSLPTFQVNGMAPGSARTLSVGVANSASESLASTGNEPRSLIAKSIKTRAIGAEPAPQPMPASGIWAGWLGQIGQSDWFMLPVQANRIFTVVAEALNETGTPSATKAMPAIGVWDGFDPIETAAAGYTPAANGSAPGETWLQVATSGNEIVRLGIADQRGDGRPDYTYRGWVLYAASVTPTRLPSTGGTIVIRGSGFRSGDTVLVGTAAAQVTSILPTEITAVVPPAASGVTGSQDLTVNDLPAFNAIAVIPSGLSYDSATGDALTLLTAPSNQVPLNVPQPFSVLVKGTDGNPAGGVTVTYAVTSGTATLACGQSVCSVTTTGDGRATLNVTATSTSIAVVTASLTNGASLQAHFYAGPSAALTALTPTLYLAAGSTVSWPVQALVLSGGNPQPNQQVTWQSSPGIVAPANPATTASTGIASVALTVGPLAEGQSAASNACLIGTTTCAAFQAFGSRPEFATLAAVSGANQSLAAASTPAPIVLRVLDMNGNPMAAGTITISQALHAWAPPCPRHGRCPQSPLLATQTTTATSALDGSVTITPLTLPGIPTSLVGLAATGNAGMLAFSVEQHP